MTLFALGVMFGIIVGATQPQAPARVTQGSSLSGRLTLLEQRACMLDDREYTLRLRFTGRVVNETDRSVDIKPETFAHTRIALFSLLQDGTEELIEEHTGFLYVPTPEVSSRFSGDPMESHLAFQAKHRLPFELLSDPDAVASKAFGVWKQKNLYGNKFMGIERTTFVIDKTGRIAQIYPKVKVEGHVAEVLGFLTEEE